LQIADGEWAAEAVRRAIADIYSAVAVTAAAGATVAGST